MNKAIKIRIYPTDEQKTLIEKTFGCCRWVWNAMLSERKEAYEKEGKSVQPTPAISTRKLCMKSYRLS